MTSPRPETSPVGRPESAVPVSGVRARSEWEPTEDASHPPEAPLPPDVAVPPSGESTNNPLILGEITLLDSFPDRLKLLRSFFNEEGAWLLDEYRAPLLRAGLAPGEIETAVEAWFRELASEGE